MYLTFEQYAQYAQYSDAGDILDDTTFFAYEFEAETIINWYTFDRLKNDTVFPEAVQRCVFELIRLARLEAALLAASTGASAMYGGSTADGGSQVIASQSNDGVSISYNLISASEAYAALSSKARGNIVETTVKRYLHGVVNSLGRKVLYRGIYEDE